MQSTYHRKRPSMPTSKSLLGMGAEVDSQLSHTSKIAYFIKLNNGLILTIYAKIYTRQMTGLLKHPIIISPTLILHHINYTKYLA